MNLGIVTALPTETATLVSRRVRIRKVYSLGDNACVIASGIGPENAADAAKQLANQGVQRLLSWGLAGGLDASIKPGVLLLPKVVITQNKRINTDSTWRSELIELLQNTFTIDDKPLVQSDRVLSSQNAKHQLHVDTGAAAVDMESAAVGEVALQAGIPFVVLRALADPLDLSLPVAIQKSITASGKLRKLRFCAELIYRPHELRSFVRLARYSSCALKNLQRAANSLNPGFGWNKK